MEWGAIAATHLMDGLPDPRKPPDAQAHSGIDRNITHQLKTYRIEDPPVKQEKDAPLRIIHSILVAAAIASNPQTQKVAGLVQLGL